MEKKSNHQAKIVRLGEPRVDSYVDGPTRVQGAKHIREGIVIAPRVGRYERGLGRVILKLVSNNFLKKDSE